LVNPYFLLREKVQRLDKIKIKNTARDVKVLNKAADLTHRVKNTYTNTKEQAEQTQQTGNGNYVEYAGDRTKESVEIVLQKGSQISQNQGKKVVQKIRARRWIRSTLDGGKTLRKTAENTVKTSVKTVKTAHPTKTAIKTSQAAVKTAMRSAQTTVRTAQSAAQAARAAVVAARVTIKAVIAALKAAIAAIRSLIALIAAGGWVALVIIIVICFVAFLVHSPLGIFFSGEDKDANVTQVANIVQEVNTDFDSKISAIKAENPDVDSMQIDYIGSADNTRIDNWMDVAAVFAVKTAMNRQNGMDVAVMDSARAELLKSVFWDMNSIFYKVEKTEKQETVTVNNDDGTTSEEIDTKTEKILHITVTSKTAEQQAEAYGFTADQMQVMNEMMSEKFRPMMFTLLGMNNSVGLTPDQLKSLYNDLPPGQFGTQIVRLALSRLGNPYSQIDAGQSDYTDCSYLTQWCYGQVGISLPRTAADQAEYCMNNHLTISPDELEPGDLIFFSLENNGRFMNISHVAIYAGNGYIVDASSSRGQVVYRSLFGGSVLDGRP